MQRPTEADYSNTYVKKYIDLVEGDNILSAMVKQVAEISEVISSVPLTKENYAYAPGKWSVKELLGHVVDTERIMAYRALCFARGEKQSLPGFEEDDYVKNANFNIRSLSEILGEFKILRLSTIEMVKGFSEEALLRKGTSNGNQITPRALLYMVVGHATHHMNVLKERYLKGQTATTA